MYSFSRLFNPHGPDDGFELCIRHPLSSPSVKHSLSHHLIRYSDLVPNKLTALCIRMERQELNCQTVSGSSSIAGGLWEDSSWQACNRTDSNSHLLSAWSDPFNLLPADSASAGNTHPIKYKPRMLGFLWRMSLALPKGLNQGWANQATEGRCVWVQVFGMTFPSAIIIL